MTSETYQPEILDMTGDSAISASTSRTLAGQRCLIENVQNVKDLANARLPVICTSPTPKNWSIVFAPATAQEAIDDAIVARALAERVLLPATLVTDKLLEETFESAELPPEKTTKNFLGALKLDKNHAKFARTDLEGSTQAQKAMEMAAMLFPKLSQEWKKRSRRLLVPFETFMFEDAETVLVVFGSSSGNAKLAVQSLRGQGQKIGLLRLHMLRPWPEQELHTLLQNVSRLAVIDSQIVLGGWSKLYHQIRTCYTGFTSNFITKNMVTVQDFIDIAQRLRAASAPERVWMI